MQLASNYILHERIKGNKKIDHQICADLPFFGAVEMADRYLYDLF